MKPLKDLARSRRPVVMLFMAALILTAFFPAVYIGVPASAQRVPKKPVQQKPVQQKPTQQKPPKQLGEPIPVSSVGPKGLGESIPVSVKATSDARINDVSVSVPIRQGKNTDYVWINVNQSYQSYYTSPDGAWPYKLKIGDPQPITLKHVPGKPVPANVIVYAERDSLKGSFRDQATPVLAAQSSEGILGVPVVLPPDPDTRHTSAPADPADMFVEPLDVTGGYEAFQCTLLIKDLVSRRDIARRNNYVYVGTNEPDLLRFDLSTVKKVGGRYRLMIRRDMRVATFTVWAYRSVADIQVPHIFAYPKNGKPTQAPVRRVVFVNPRVQVSDSLRVQ